MTKQALTEDDYDYLYKGLSQVQNELRLIRTVLELYVGSTKIKEVRAELNHQARNMRTMMYQIMGETE